MSQPPQGGQGPQDGQPTQGQGDSGAQGGSPPQGPGPQGPGPQVPGPQGYPVQPGYPPQAYPAQGYPPQGGFPQQGYPGQQPYAGGPGPQGGGYGVPPGGPQPYQQNPYQQPYQPGPNPPGNQPKKKRTGLFVLVGAGALALILAVVAVAVNLGGRSEGASGGSTRSGNGGASAPAAATASDAVNGYLQAVAKGDAQAAVGYAVDPASVDTTYMTPAVLAASAKLAPLTDIQVATVDPDATSVGATYKLGSTPVSTSLEVMKIDDTWKLITVASDLDLTAVQEDGIPMLMNGTKVRPGVFSVLPGAYHFTSGVRNFDYGNHPNLRVRYPSDFPDITRITPQISKRGRAGSLSALRKSWSKCLKSKDPKPGGCPNKWTGTQYKFKKGAVKWSRKGSDPVKKPLTEAGTTAIRYQVRLDLTLKGRCTAGGQTGTCSGSLTGRALARADVSANKVKFSWVT